MVPCFLFLVVPLCGGLFVGCVFLVVYGLLLCESSVCIVLAWFDWTCSYLLVGCGGA
jgi:hypothetical protein